MVVNVPNIFQNSSRLEKMMKAPRSHGRMDIMYVDMLKWGISVFNIEHSLTVTLQATLLALIRLNGKQLRTLDARLTSVVTSRVVEHISMPA